MNEAVVSAGWSRLAKLTRSAEEVLAPKLEDRERVWTAVPVTLRDPWVYLVSTLLVLGAPLFWLEGWVDHRTANGLSPGISALLSLAFVGLFIILLYIAQGFLTKPRILVMTDRRMLLCTTDRLLANRDAGVEAEWRRIGTSVERQKKNRLLVCVDQATCLRFRTSHPYSLLVEDWVPKLGGVPAGEASGPNDAG